MGRYRAKYVIVKELPELTLVFWNQSAIYAKPKDVPNPRWYIFHKYHAPLGTYGRNWRPFKRRLLKSKTMTFGRCCQLATHDEILAKGAVGKLDFAKKPVEIRFANWSVKGIANDM